MSEMDGSQEQAENPMRRFQRYDDRFRARLALFRAIMAGRQHEEQGVAYQALTEGVDIMMESIFDRGVPHDIQVKVEMDHLLQEVGLSSEDPTTQVIRSDDNGNQMIVHAAAFPTGDGLIWRWVEFKKPDTESALLLVPEDFIDMWSEMEYPTAVQGVWPTTADEPND